MRRETHVMSHESGQPPCPRLPALLPLPHASGLALALPLPPFLPSPPVCLWRRVCWRAAFRSVRCVLLAVLATCSRRMVMVMVSIHVSIGSALARGESREPRAASER